MTIAEQLVAAIGPRRSAKEIAESVYECLKRLAVEEGMSENEVIFRQPGEERYFEDRSSYCVAWEAGPYQWSYAASIAISGATGVVVKAQHSFDLCFDPSND
ncbi:MAG: hypothetical protein ACK4SZ_15910 [Allosphingosinicella sp.]|uniref:hypothetical protein n=1 Tax=Allosphingosinicella sp. TaxID=2823234 RepID=UPI003948FF70